MTRPQLRIVALVASLTFLDLVVWFSAVPLLPRWQREIGLSNGAAGVIVAAYGVAVLVLSIPVGQLADRIGARRLTIAATSLFAITTPFVGFADAFWQLVLLRGAQGLFSAVSWTAGLAWLISSLEPEARVRGIALVNAAATTATVFGPFIGGPLVALVGLRAAMIAVGGVVLAVAIWAIREPFRGVAEPTEHAALAAVRTSLREPALRAAYAMILFASTAMAATQLLAPLALARDGVSDARVGWIFTSGAVGSVAVVLILGRSGDRANRMLLARLATIAVAGLLVMLAFGPPAPSFAAAVMVSSAVTSVLFVVAYPLCSVGARRAGIGQGVALGALNTVWAFGSVAAPVAAGFLADHAGGGAAFVAVAATAAFALVALAPHVETAA